MSSSGSSMSSIPFKSKKSLQSTPKSKSISSIATQTPDKPAAELPPRLRNRRVCLSVKEVRQIAQGNQKRSDEVTKSARRQISSWPEESTGGPRKSRDSAAAVNHEPAQIPAKFEILGEFFDCLDSSIRLLKLKRSMSTFTNISPKIECLTDRRFSHRHLAQLKYIMPEVIEIKRVLVHDERTSCMKPDLHVSLNVEAVECDGNLKSESKNLHLRKVFRSRLADFYKTHPQGDEIPEELLPEPFNRSKQDQAPTSSSLAEIPTDGYVNQRQYSSSAAETVTLETQQPAVVSHFSRSFRRHFSQNIKTSEAENTHQNAAKFKLGTNNISCSEETSSAASSLVKVLPPNPIGGSKCLAFSELSAGVPTHCLPGTPCKELNSDNRDGTCKQIASIQSTPAKVVLSPSTSMSRTPRLQPQKRCYMSPDDDSNFTKEKLVRRPLRTRSLKFEGPVENVKHDGREDVSANDDDDDFLNILPESLLQSIREKERKAQEERDPAISQAKRRRQMIAQLPKLFNMIHFFFQSIKRSVITKEELMHKIIAGHLDIVDSREIEEQLNLLVELVPEWISKKLASSGDLLFCINKTTSAEAIRACLEEAK